MEFPPHITGDEGASGRRQASEAKPAAAADGAPPRTVIRGESFNPFPIKGETEPLGAFTDFLNVTYPLHGDRDPLKSFIPNFFATAGDLFGDFEDRGRGLHGWTRSFASRQGKTVFAYGGQRDTAFLSIPGEGCALVANWDALTVWLRDWANGRITRWDGAVDDFEGHHPLEEAVAAYQNGGFNCGGMQPTYSMRGDWLIPTGKGRTWYVGDRTSGKLFRAYEKGKQLGDKTSPWIRHEIELHNEGRAIPWDVLCEPGRFVAGAYPYLAWVHGTASRIPTIRQEGTIGLKALTEHCRKAYGRLINTLRREGASDSEIVDRLLRAGIPNRLALSTLLDIRPELP